MAGPKGILVVISGPSGVGKSTICREIVSRTGAQLSVSTTTRPRSNSEAEGRDYFFVTKEQFERLLAADMLLEHAEVFGNCYGTPKEAVMKAVDDGRTVILEIDVQGGMQVMSRFPEALTIFIMPPSRQHLVERLTGRGRDSAEVTRRRLEAADAEIAQARQHYSKLVVNDDLETAIREVVAIIEDYKERRIL